MAPQGAPLQQGRGQGGAGGSWSSCHDSWGGSGTGKRTGVADEDVRTHPCPPLEELRPQASGSATCSVLGPRPHWKGTPAGLLLGELSGQRCDPRPISHEDPTAHYTPTMHPLPTPRPASPSHPNPSLSSPRAATMTPPFSLPLEDFQHSL